MEANVAKKRPFLTGGQVIIGIAIIGVLTTAAVYFIRQAKMLSDYCYKFAKVKINSVGLKKIDLTLWFKIKNKSDIDIKITKQQYTVYVNENAVSNITSNDLINIPPQQWAYFKIGVLFNPLQVLNIALQNVSELLTDKDSIKIRIAGKLSAGSEFLRLKNIPIDYSTTLGELLSSEEETDSEC